MKIKPKKFSVNMVASFSSTIDIVIYKDEQDRLYRLRYIVDDEQHSYKEIEALYRVMRISQYAPEIIDGEIIGEYSDEFHVKVGNDIYVLQKNGEKR
ncbi:MAG TPA: hypothetical protein VIO11_02095 [Candidatus Methanoperedens sp.]